jgi:threonine dehydratase
LIPLAEIEAARDRIAGAAVRTPLLQLPDTNIWLKLENLQPVASFKIRGATNAIRAASPEQLAGGVVTASAGNMAQGVAWAAREAGVPATIVCPDHAPQAKLERIERLGGRVIQVPWEQWWQAIVESEFEGVDGLFVHPVQDELVMAGNGTIGLELVEDLPDLETVLVPYGGGGLSTGIASAVKQLKPGVRVYAVDPETGPSASAAFEADEPVTVEHRPSFVDGSGGKGVLESMWPYVREALDGAHVVSLEETAAALRLLAERMRVVAEGAGALALAAALSGRVDGGKTVCIVSGGNIDTAVLTRILAGETPA